ncbi:hypothetical protein HY967_01175, partial [Candidatus Jorgensenbacteria bacterium]|nr:hypothetical protein [Candidatus Jorgensenbacteria bacterium]
MKIFYTPSLVVLALVLVSSVAFAFTGPTTAPGVGGGLLVSTSTSLGIASTTIYSDQSQLRFQTVGGASQHIIFLPNGNVGIATTSPAYKLDVVGDIRATNNLIGNISGSLSATNVTGPASFGTTYGTFAYAFPGSLAIGTTTTTNLPANGLYVQGNVGIGTSTPTAKLHVDGGLIQSDYGGGTSDALNGLSIYLRSANVGIGIRDTATASGYTIEGSGTGGLYFGTATETVGSQVQRVAFTSAGNVVIGATSTSYKLEVYGDVNVTSTSVYRRGGTAGLTVTCPSGQVLATTTVSGGIVTGGSCVSLSGGGGGVTGNGIATYFPYWMSSSTLSSSSSLYQAANGNIGVGTNIPTGLFQVSNSAATSVLYVATSTIQVGIGTPPVGSNWTLHLKVPGGGPNILLEHPTADSDSSIRFTEGGPGVGVELLYKGNADELQFIDTAPYLPRMVFERITGRLGIGTTTPTEALEVVGNIKASGSIIGNLSGSLSASNVTGPASFGTTFGTYSYSFPGSLAIGTTTTVGLPANGLYVQGNVAIATATTAYVLNVGGDINIPASTALIGYRIGGKIALTTGANDFLHINGNNGFTSGVWFGSSTVTLGSGAIYMGANSASPGQISLVPSTLDTTPRIRLEGGTGDMWLVGKLGVGRSSTSSYAVDVVGDVNISSTSTYSRGG